MNSSLEKKMKHRKILVAMKKHHYLNNSFLVHHILMIICYFSTFANSSASKIKTLPGFQGPLPFQLETGYIGVDDFGDVQLFYYFIESERSPGEDPLILWLTGGPGCSGFSGLVYEIGPLNFNVVEYNGSLPTFKLNPYSWTKVSNIIFLDAPVGTGFSYSKSLQGWKTSDTKAVNQTISFLRKWLDNHPVFNNNPLYIAGDSYSGMLVPIIVQELANVIEAQGKPCINLKGYILGNPLTDNNVDVNSRIPYAHRMGLISDELYAATKRSCKREYVTVDSRNIKCAMNLQAVSKCTKMLNHAQILEQNCVFASPKPNEENRRSLKENPKNLITEDQIGCRAYGYLLSHYWVNDDSVCNALHVKKGTIDKWERCIPDGTLPYTKEIQSSIHYHLKLSSRGYSSLIYSGDHDFKVPYLGTETWIKSLNFSIIDDWRPWFVDSQIAGYTRTYSNRMTFATLKCVCFCREGDTAPEYLPKECLAMLARWLSHNPL